MLLSLRLVPKPGVQNKVWSFFSEDAPISYDTVGNPLSSTVETPKPETSSRNSCFNCGGPHMISECKEPKDHARIAAARRQQGGGGPQARYHVDEKQKLAHVKPGLPSKRLRKALGLKDKRLPEYIYRYMSQETL